MEVTEHNVDADLTPIEVQALLTLVKVEMLQEDNDKFIKLFYTKIYGKLLGMAHLFDAL